MGFVKMIDLLQSKHEGYITIVNCGNFYIAKGKDAVLLHQKLDLKTNCIQPEICKVGFPLNSIEKYIQKIKELEYSFVVYRYESKSNTLEILKKYDGKYLNEITEEKVNCYLCKNTVKMYKKEDKYVQAVANLYEKENAVKKDDENYEKEKIKEKRKGLWILKILKKKKKIN